MAGYSGGSGGRSLNDANVPARYDPYAGRQVSGTEYGQDTQDLLYGAPQWTTSPTGAVFRFNAGTRQWDPSGQLTVQPNEYGSSGAPGAYAGRHNPALDALIRQVQSQSATPFTPPRVTAHLAPLHLDAAQQAATYGAAKERTGNALQAAMRGLQSQLASRGLTGTSIDADRSAQLFGSGLTDLANTDRQQAEQDASRLFATEGVNTDRLNQADTLNANNELSADIANQNANQSRLSFLARLLQMQDALQYGG